MNRLTCQLRHLMFKLLNYFFLTNNTIVRQLTYFKKNKSKTVNFKQSFHFIKEHISIMLTMT